MLLFVILHIYFVSFIDKPEKSVPQLSPRAVEQRARWGIETDEKDYPVSPLYLNKVRQSGGKILHTSRWMNGATVEMDDEAAKAVRSLSCVSSVEMTKRENQTGFLSLRKRQYAQQLRRIVADDRHSLPTDEQLQLFNLTPLHEAGYRGQGILMTVCDGAFHHADTLGCFRQEQELGHYDFTTDTDDFYGPTGGHGTLCLSTISAQTELYQGAAPGAAYYLMRTEENYDESPKEMDNLVAALEKADSLGVNVFSVSLGYAAFDNPEWNLTQSSMDGTSTRVSRAALIAARKGMLVVVAAGNEGEKEWHTISAPGDADSILTVGAVDMQGMIAGFSSYGPSADGRVKPEVCAVGRKCKLINANGELIESNGTSFATPLMAGLAACLWSALPDENAMQIRERIIRSANRYSQPDYGQYGYGIPDAWKAYTDVQSTKDNVQCTKDEGRGTKKVIENGLLYLMYEGRMYDVHGRRRE